MGGGEGYSGVGNVSVLLPFPSGQDFEVFQCGRYDMWWKCDFWAKIFVGGMYVGGMLVRSCGCVGVGLGVID